MKDKVLVRVQIPMAGLNYDVRLPADISVLRVTDTLYRIVSGLHKSELPIGPKPCLWLQKNACALDTEKTLREQGVTDSDMLFMI